MIELGHDEINPLQPHKHEPVPLAGKRVLLVGAAGGVGHFPVQLAKWLGSQNVHAIVLGFRLNEIYSQSPSREYTRFAHAAAWQSRFSPRISASAL